MQSQLQRRILPCWRRGEDRRHCIGQVQLGWKAACSRRAACSWLGVDSVEEDQRGAAAIWMIERGEPHRVGHVDIADNLIGGVSNQRRAPIRRARSGSTHHDAAPHFASDGCAWGVLIRYARFASPLIVQWLRALYDLL
jgi:hypothetical protein